MQKISISFLILLVVLLSIAPSCSVAGDGGSAYSILGIGDLRYWPSTRSAGMGFTGIGLPGQTSINAYAPATWSRINRSRLDAGVVYEGFRSNDGTNARYLARVDFNGAALGIPVSQPNGIVWVVGITPYSRVNYDTYTSGKFVGTADTIGYTLHYNGTGGIARAYTGLSYAPTEDIALGFSVNYLFGSRNTSRELVPASTSYVGATESESNSVSGLNFTIGGLYSGFGGLGSALRPLTFGFFLTSRARLSTRNQIIYQFAPNLSATELDTVGVPTGDLVVPVTYGFGLGYQAGERYIFAADYVAEPWQSSEFNGAPLQGARNSFRLGVGAERLPSKELNDPWRERLALRLGVYYHSTYVQVNGNGITEYGITGGATIPVFNDPRFGSESRFSFSLEYAKRATGPGNPIRDTIWRCTVGFTIGETWFVRPEEE